MKEEEKDGQGPGKEGEVEPGEQGPPQAKPLEEAGTVPRDPGDEHAGENP